MAQTKEVIELEITPIRPDTIGAAKKELIPMIEATLRNAERGDILTEKHLRIYVEKTFPTDASIIVVLTLLSGLALETYKAVILPALRRRFKIKQRSKRKKEGAK